jgi:hypothetical protein
MGVPQKAHNGRSKWLCKHLVDAFQSFNEPDHSICVKLVTLRGVFSRNADVLCIPVVIEFIKVIMKSFYKRVAKRGLPRMKNPYWLNIMLWQMWCYLGMRGYCLIGESQNCAAAASGAG